MAYTNIFDIKEEILIFLRNQDVISTSTRGVTTSQDTGTFSNDSSHTLATNPTLIKNVRNITVDATPLVFSTDYTVNYTTGVISFTSPQTGDYEINYDQGSTDKIFPDFPQPQIKINDMPRIGFDIISGTSTKNEIGGPAITTDYTLQITCYDKSQRDLDGLLSTVREKINNLNTGLTDVDYVTATATGPMLKSPVGEDKVMQRNQDFIVFIADEV